MANDLDDKKLLKNLLKSVKELTEILKKSNLPGNIENTGDVTRVTTKRIKIEHADAMTSPMVGTVFLSPEPKAKSFI